MIWNPVGRACLAIALLATLSHAARAQTAADVFPLAPEDGLTVGVRPTFRIGASGTDLPKLKFRIVLSRDEFDTEAYVFDQLEDPDGWVYAALGGEFGAMYRVKKPLEDGEYEWRAEVWNGIEWLRGDTVYRLTVDGVPPADVEGLRMEVDHDRGGVVLDWDAVTTDRNGRPEYVRLYHVYRYKRRSFFFVIRPFEIATTEDTHYVDRDPEALDTSLVFYKITAEDEAGNEPERRF